MASLLIDSEKCTKCGICVAECPMCIIGITGEASAPSWVDGAEALCINCGHCVAICPPGALELSTMPVRECVPIMKDLETSPEQLEQLLKSRRSIRVFKEKTVEHEKLAKLIDIARYAPSGHNAQPLQWLIVKQRDTVKQAAQMTVDYFKDIIQKNPTFATVLPGVFEAVFANWDSGIDVITRGAPHLVIAHADKSSLPTGDADRALTYLELAAHTMGIGACWAGFVQGGINGNPALAKLLRLPENHTSFGVMMIGYPIYKYSRIPLRKDAQIIWR